MQTVKKLRKFKNQLTNIVKSRLGIGNEAILKRGNLPAYFKQVPRRLSLKIGDEKFDKQDVLHGTYSIQEDSFKISNSFWVEVSNKSECIRYYPIGLASNENRNVMIYFSGDVLLRTARGERLVTPIYTKKTPNDILKMMEKWSKSASNTPAIFIARPGIYGSSGNHQESRQTDEIHLMGKTLDLLKQKYKIDNFIITGQSGGGLITAAMLNLRTDISAAVITAGLLTTHLLDRRFRTLRKTPGVKKTPLEKLYDPTLHIDDMQSDSQPTIIVISDPRDQAIPFYSQIIYVNKLREKGLTVHHIFSHAPLPKRHALAIHGQKAAALIAKGVDIKDIRRAMIDEDLNNAD